MSGASTLLLRLEGPLQSWGYRSRFKNRDTGLDPSKSGVVGLLCCALGRDRSESPVDLAALKMHVRVDRQGHLLSDFHTAGGGVFRGRTDYFAPTSAGGKGKNPVITEKQYLADASFLVALEGDPELAELLAERLVDPVWPLNLGRKSCPPSEPIFVSTSTLSPREAMAEVETPQRRSSRLRYVWELEAADRTSEARNDVPVSWSDRLDRQYAVRFVRSELMEWPK